MSYYAGLSTSLRTSNECVILCNGSTILDHDLSLITCDTIGLNRSWELHTSDIHIMLDSQQFADYRRITGNCAELDLPKRGTRAFITGSTIPLSSLVDPSTTYALNVYDDNTGCIRFTNDPNEIVYLCGTVTWVALQVALYLGYSVIYFVGLDLCPSPVFPGQVTSSSSHTHGKFYGGSWMPFMEARQRELLGWLSGRRVDVELVNLNTPERTRVRSIPIESYGEVFGGE